MKWVKKFYELQCSSMLIFLSCWIWLSSEMSQIHDMHTTFSYRLREHRLSKTAFFYLISTSFPGFSVSFWFPFSLNERETKNLGKEVSFTYQAKQVSINIENRPQGKLSSEMRMDCHMRNQQVLFNFFYDVTPSESNQKVKAKDESIKHISYLLVCVLPVHDNWYNREKKCCFWIGNISKNKSLWERATKYQTHHFKPLQGAVDYE